MCRHLFTLLAVLFLMPVSVAAQAGSVTLRATVSETVALSVAPNFANGKMDVWSSGNTVRLTLSGTDEVTRVPLLVRSNTAFKISAAVESQADVLTQLSVIDVRPTGRLVSRGVVNALVVKPEPLLVISGPRVSLGGTLKSPDNALEITLLIRPKPQSDRGSLVHLTLTATAGPLIQ